MQRLRSESAPPFHSASQMEAADLLLDGLRSGEPVVVMTGAAGIGKTTVLDLALAQLGPGGPRILRIVAPFPAPLVLQRRFASLLDMPDPRNASPADLAQALLSIPEPAPGVSSVAVLVDGAEDLPGPALQYLWLMHSLTSAGRPALQLVLVGRDTLWRRLGEESLTGLRRGVSARLAMQPLPPAEAGAFLRHVLQARGRSAEPPAKAEMLQLGAGVPGRLITLLDAACARLPQRRAITLSALQTALGAPSPNPEPVIARRDRLAAIRTRLSAVPPWGLGTAAAGAVVLFAAWQFLAGETKPAARPAPMPELAPLRTPQHIRAPAPQQPARSHPPPGAASHPVTATQRPATQHPVTPHPVQPPQPAGPAGAPDLRWAARDATAMREAAVALFDTSGRTGVLAAAMASRAATALASLLPQSLPALPARADPGAAAAVAAPPSTPPVPTVVPAPAMLVLADATAVRVELLYPRGDARAQARALRAAETLRADHVNVAEPVAVARPWGRPGVGYFFLSDRDGARDVARRLAGIVGPGFVEPLPMQSAPPPPGTVQVMLAGR